MKFTSLWTQIHGEVYDILNTKYEHRTPIARVSKIITKFEENIHLRNRSKIGKSEMANLLKYIKYNN